jgi:hypothetical protein
MLGSKLTTLVCVWPLDLVNVVPISKHVCIDIVVHYIPKLTIAWNGMLYPSIINLKRLGCKLRNIEGSNPLKGTSFYQFVLNVGYTFWVLNIFSCKVLHEEFILMLIPGVQGPLVWWCSIKPLCQERSNHFVALGKNISIIIWRFFRRPLVYHWTIFNAKSMCLWVIVRRKSKPYKVDMGNSLTCVLEPTSAKLNLVMWYWQAMGMNPFVTNALSFWKRKNWNSKAFPWGLLLHEIFGTSLVPRPVKH